MRRVLFAACAVLVLAAALPVAAAKKKEAWAWPAMPTPPERDAGMKLKSEEGIVVLVRKTTVELNSFYTSNPGIKKEEFVRFLVTSEDGVRSATIPVLLGDSYTLDVLEGRTVSPEGQITTVDREKDVDQVDLKKYGDDEAAESSATVRFPAVQVGAVLDLHYTCELKDRTPYFYVESLLYDMTSAVKTDLELRIEGCLPGKRWSLLTLGDAYGNCKLEKLPDEAGFGVHLGTFPVEYSERNAPPALHTSPTLLAYIDVSDIRVKGEKNKVLTRALTVDHWGRVQGITFPAGDSSTEWWALYMQDDKKFNTEFVKRAGKAEDINVEAIAPSSLPLEERLRKLYRHVQEAVRQDPDAEKVDSLSDVLKRGANRNWQGTLLFAYLLNKSHISYEMGLVANRRGLRFSPVIRNGWLYDFFTAVIVELPGKRPLALVPGDFSLGFGCLPFDYQDALVLRPEGEEGVKVCYSQVNPPEEDAITFGYSLEMDASGGASGTVTVAKRGASARGFRRWYVLREIRHANPDVDKKTKKSDQERKEQLNEEVEDAFWIPGEAFTFSGYELVRCDKDASSPLEIKASAQGKGIGQANGDRWLVLVNPLAAGMSNAYKRPFRKYPIWNGAGGRRTAEGELVLPAGAKVLELPKGEEITGPEGAKARYTVEALERDGRVVLKSRLEYDMPLIVPTPQYGAYRSYLDGIARMGQDRCIVQLSAEKELE